MSRPKCRYRKLEMGGVGRIMPSVYRVEKTKSEAKCSSLKLKDISISNRRKEEWFCFRETDNTGWRKEKVMTMMSKTFETSHTRKDVVKHKS